MERSKTTGTVRRLRAARTVAVIWIGVLWVLAGAVMADPKPALTEPGTTQKAPADLAKLVELLRDSAATPERMAAARALGRSGTPQALAPLLDTLKDEHIAVRWSAVEALGELGNREAVPQLLQLLGKEEAYRWNRRLVVSALGNLRDPKAVPALVELLKDEDEFLRKITLFALRKIGDPKAFLPMVAMLRDPEFWVRRTAQRLLSEWTAGLHAGPPPRDPAGWTRWFERTGFPSPRPHATRKARR